MTGGGAGVAAHGMTGAAHKKKEAARRRPLLRFSVRYVRD